MQCKVYSDDTSRLDIDCLDTMYPSYATYIKTSGSTILDMKYFHYSTVYGYAVSDSTFNGKKLESGEFFCFPISDDGIIVGGDLFLVFRLGFKGQKVIGTVEHKGRLSYIDGCSDSLLVYPPRMGDPSLNLLYFPKNINQSFHTHPSIRIGLVISGKGYACLNDDELDLTAGSMFMLDEQELHRFRTEDEEMRIIAYHPDGDWGPTDQNHTMLNRTYIK
jgi:quercetin dioxygenase-like cupin family protein